METLHGLTIEVSKLMNKNIDWKGGLTGDLVYHYNPLPMHPSFGRILFNPTTTMYNESTDYGAPFY